MQNLQVFIVWLLFIYNFNTSTFCDLMFLRCSFLMSSQLFHMYVPPAHVNKLIDFLMSFSLWPIMNRPGISLEISRELHLHWTLRMKRCQRREVAQYISSLTCCDLQNKQHSKDYDISFLHVECKPTFRDGVKISRIVHPPEA